MTRTLNRTVEAGGKLYPAGTPEADVDGLVEREDVWDGDPDPQDPNGTPDEGEGSDGDPDPQDPNGTPDEGEGSDGDSEDEAPEAKPTRKGQKTS